MSAKTGTICSDSRLGARDKSNCALATFSSESRVRGAARLLSHENETRKGESLDRCFLQVITHAHSLLVAMLARAQQYNRHQSRIPIASALVGGRIRPIWGQGEVVYSRVTRIFMVPLRLGPPEFDIFANPFVNTSHHGQITQSPHPLHSPLVYCDCEREREKRNKTLSGIELARLHLSTADRATVQSLRRHVCFPSPSPLSLSPNTTED
jgi:hypothetical protein